MISKQVFSLSVAVSALILAAKPCASESIAGNQASPQQIDVANITVELVSTSLAKSKKVETIAGTTNNPDEPPFMNGEPKHLRIVFDNDKLPDFTDYLHRQVLIYPVAPYASLFHGKEKTSFDKLMSELTQINKTKSTKGIKELPMLPSAEAYEAFHNQVKYLNFKQGSGVAFLSCYRQEDAPINNGDFFYTYQGLTSDGKYYISAFFPVQASKLKKNLPSKQGVDYLGKLQPAEFTPKLNQIDELLSSISIQPKK
jgi:hypothetical protein